jgi:hypothetical protein
MPTIRIKDMNDGCLAFDFEDLLELPGRQALQSVWRCKVEGAISKALPINLADAFNAHEGHDGLMFKKLASETRQVIDGVFEAFNLQSESPWVRLEAIDSSYWEVWATDENILKPLRARFTDVEDVEGFLT